MTRFRRYSVFVVPEGAFYRAGAQWLGWDCVASQALDPPEIGGLPLPVAQITAAPRLYGFHGTIKPPFRLRPEVTEADLTQALIALCATRKPVPVDDLMVRKLGGFVAIVPARPCPPLADLVATIVTGLDRFRAPLTEAELTKRRRAKLTDRQDAMLTQWGYPYVLDDFRFHLTLTGRLGSKTAPVADRLAALFTPVIPRPFTIERLCLLGEDAEGRFHLCHSAALTG